jgi:hypothetical protein
MLNSLNAYNKKRAWSCKEEKILTSLWETKSMKEIKKRLPRRSIFSIYIRANRMGLKRDRSIVQAKNVNHRYLDKWSNNMAYLLGFIASDGNIWNSDKKYRVRFELKKIDIAHLYKIRKELENKNKIYCNPKRDSAALTIHSRSIVRRLISLGIVPKKSLILKFPKIPNQYLSHFIRGLYDGDGMIKVEQTNFQKIPIVNFDLCGTKDIVSKTRNVLMMKLKLPYTAIRKIEGEHGHYLYSVRYVSDNAGKIFAWFYKDADLFLERKLKKYKQYLKLMDDYKKNLILWKKELRFKTLGCRACGVKGPRHSGHGLCDNCKQFVYRFKNKLNISMEEAIEKVKQYRNNR